MCMIKDGPRCELMRAGLGVAPCAVCVCEGSYRLMPNAPVHLKNPQIYPVDQTLKSHTHTHTRVIRINEKICMVSV